jgi:hypothetical protein
MASDNAATIEVPNEVNNTIEVDEVANALGVGTSGTFQSLLTGQQTQFEIGPDQEYVFLKRIGNLHNWGGDVLDVNDLYTVRKDDYVRVKVGFQDQEWENLYFSITERNVNGNKDILKGRGVDIYGPWHTMFIDKEFEINTDEIIELWKRGCEECTWDELCETCKSEMDTVAKQGYSLSKSGVDWSGGCNWRKEAVKGLKVGSFVRLCVRFSVEDHDVATFKITEICGAVFKGTPINLYDSRTLLPVKIEGEHTFGLDMISTIYKEEDHCNECEKIRQALEVAVNFEVPGETHETKMCSENHPLVKFISCGGQYGCNMHEDRECQERSQPVTIVVDVETGSSTDVSCNPFFRDLMIDCDKDSVEESVSRTCRVMYGCHICDYDICADCYEKM